MVTLDAAASPDKPLVVLVVCSGNTCRSPLVEGLLRVRLADLPVAVRSAGTSAAVGAAMSAEAQRIAAELGVPNAAEHRSRPLSADDLRAADLILTLDRSHRRSVLELLPSANRRTFALREFGRLAAMMLARPFPARLGTATGPGAQASAPLHDGTTTQRLRAAIERAARSRESLDAPANPSEDDVIDPFRRGRSTYRRATSQLLPAVESTVELFRMAAPQERDRDVYAPQAAGRVWGSTSTFSNRTPTR